jgi:hypothetical protein
MSTIQELTPITVDMVHAWQKGNRKRCYELYFNLGFEDRQLVRETFTKMRNYHIPQARKDAKGIYKMLEENTDKEVKTLVDMVHEMLRHWLCSDRATFHAHFLALDPGERELFMNGLDEIIGTSDNAEFRKAAKDIPLFLSGVGEKVTLAVNRSPVRRFLNDMSYRLQLFCRPFNSSNK